MIACDDRGRLAELDRIAERHLVASGAAPGASVAVAWRRTNGRWAVGAGAAGTLAPWTPSAVSPDTPYDLASVSKPFTAVALVRAARDRGVALDGPLGATLPAARGAPLEHVAIELLLAHRAGLEAHLPLFAPLCMRRGMRVETALARAAGGLCRPPPPPGSRDGVAPLYSDLGFLLAGAAAERIGGAPLDHVIAEHVAAPLGLAIGSARQWLARDRTFMVRVAPTERVPWRGGVVRGVVHDENAWAIAGHGCAGHAGLFGTAEAVARFGVAVLEASQGRGGDWLAADALEPLLRERPGGSLRAGFDGKSESGSAAGSVAGARTFGHLGFTGTSLWCDPDADVVVAVLTNRVCPTRDHLVIRSARPVAHDALFALGRTLAETG